MTHSVIQGTLAAAVAAAGTFTASYPDGKDEGNFYLAMGHKLVLRNGDVLSYPTDFDVTLGTSSITITNKQSVSWEAGAKFVLQLEEQGERAYRNQVGSSPSALVPSATKVDQIMVSLCPDAADPDGLVASVNPASGATFTMDGALVVSGVGIFDTPRNVVMVSAGDDSGGTKYITVTGKDIYNNTIVEKIVGVNTATAYGVKAFKKVTSIVATADIGTVTIGSGNIIGLPVFLPSAGHVEAVLENGVRLPKKTVLHNEIDSTRLLAGTSVYALTPFAGFIERATTVLTTAINTTGGSITVENATVAVTGLAVVIATGSVGDMDTDVPTTTTGNDATTQFAARSAVEIVGDAAFDSTGALSIYLEFNTEGIFQAGARTAGGATSTSADVRGTFRPTTDPDGDKVYQVFLALPDSGFIGMSQYAG